MTALTVELGGSDAAPAAGIHPHTSAVMRWAELTGRVQRDESEAMRWGTLLEPLIVAELQERGYETLPASADGFRDSRYPWLVGHPDGFVSLDGERAILEVKTIGQWAHRANGDAVPIHYQAQAQVYMHLTGLRRALVATLVGGQRLEVGIVQRDDRAIALLLAFLRAFHEHVRRDKPPAPDGSKSASEALAAMFPQAQAEKVYRLNRREWRDVRDLRARREQRDRIEAQIAALENRLKLAIGDAETALAPNDGEAIRWGTVTQRRLDQSAFKQAHPNIYEEFVSTSTTRRFTIV